MFSRIAVFGLGLLGGSICRRLRRMSHNGEITAFARSPEKLAPALRDGCIDRAENIDAINLEGTDLAVICTPVYNSIELLKVILDSRSLEPDSLVIDVGSVKGPIVRAALGHPRADRFIGCHPMAGSEKTGYDAARHDLYEGAPVILTPHEHNARTDVGRVRRFWESLGAVVTETDAVLHDRVLARTSHLPHFLACAAVHALRRCAETMGPDLGLFLGNGFRDVTRIASGSPEMWTDIFLANSENLAIAARETISLMEEILKGLESDHGREALAEFFERARELKKGM